jgi:hypothetical protein
MGPLCGVDASGLCVGAFVAGRHGGSVLPSSLAALMAIVLVVAASRHLAHDHPLVECKPSLQAELGHG